MPENKVNPRKTFAIISHPDAGKTTLTEKLLLFGGAIQQAGAVKARGENRRAHSDWMKVEQERGISVASSVMTFDYRDITFNLLDTPGHEDFSEDTYRVLTAVDSAIMVLDSAKGIETQTKKLFEVCRLRNVPILTFINKLDRPSKEPFDLLDEVEKELRIRVRPLAFPISNGPTFRGVYNLYEKNLSLFTSDEKLTADAQTAEISDLASPELDSYIGAKFAEQLRSDVELVEGVYDEFDREAYLRGEGAMRTKHSSTYLSSSISGGGILIPVYLPPERISIPMCWAIFLSSISMIEPKWVLTTPKRILLNILAAIVFSHFCWTRLRTHRRKWGACFLHRVSSGKRLRRAGINISSMP